MSERPLNILAVESDPVVLEYERDLLEVVGGDRVIACPDVEQAEAVLRVRHIDLVMVRDGSVLDNLRVPTVVFTQNFNCLDGDQREGLVKRVRVERLSDISQIAHDFHQFVLKIRGPQ